MIINFILFGTVLSIKNRRNMFPEMFKKVREKVRFSIYRNPSFCPMKSVKKPTNAFCPFPNAFISLYLPQNFKV